MLKIVILFTKIVVTIAISLLFISCQSQGIIGSGNITTENRIINDNFKAIEAVNGLNVILEQSSKSSVTVVADDNLQNHIITKVNNGVLRISFDNNNFSNIKSKDIFVKMPTIEAIETTSAANLKSRNTLKCDVISINSSSGSNIEIAVEANKVSCESSSGSHTEIRGKSINLETKSSSGSSIDAEKLLSNDILAIASSGSTTDVYPLVNLNAEASSGGSIKYHNVPKNLNKNSSSGGSINKE